MHWEDFQPSQQKQCHYHSKSPSFPFCDDMLPNQAKTNLLPRFIIFINVYISSILKVITILSGFYFFSIDVHDELREIDCLVFTIFFSYKISKNRKRKFFAFWTITREPIKIQTHSASQNDRQNLSFVKNTYGNAKKMAGKGGKVVIYESQILGLTI